MARCGTTNNEFAANHGDEGHHLCHQQSTLNKPCATAPQAGWFMEVVTPMDLVSACMKTLTEHQAKMDDLAMVCSSTCDELGRKLNNMGMVDGAKQMWTHDCCAQS